MDLNQAVQKQAGREQKHGILTAGEFQDLQEGRVGDAVVSILSRDDGCDATPGLAEHAMMSMYFLQGKSREEVAGKFGHIEPESVSHAMFVYTKEMADRTGIPLESLREALKSIRRMAMTRELRLRSGELEEIRSGGLATVIGRRLNGKKLIGTVLTQNQHEVLSLYARQGQCIHQIAAALELNSDSHAAGIKRNAVVCLQKWLTLEGVSIAADGIEESLRKLHADAVRRDVLEWEGLVACGIRTPSAGISVPPLQIRVGSEMRKEICGELLERMRIPVKARGCEKIEVSRIPGVGVLLKAIPAPEKARSEELFLVALDNGAWLKEAPQSFTEKWQIRGSGKHMSAPEVFILMCHGYGPVPFSSGMLNCEVHSLSGARTGKFALLPHFSRHAKGPACDLPDEYPYDSVLLGIHLRSSGPAFISTSTPKGSCFGVFRFGEIPRGNPVVQFDYLDVPNNPWAERAYRKSVASRFQAYFEGKILFPPPPSPLRIRSTPGQGRYVAFKGNIPVPAAYTGETLSPALTIYPSGERFVGFYSDYRKATLEDSSPVMIVELNDEGIFRVVD